MRFPVPSRRNRFGLPALDCALLVATVALLLLGLSPAVRAGLVALVLPLGGGPL